MCGASNEKDFNLCKDEDFNVINGKNIDLSEDRILRDKRFINCRISYGPKYRNRTSIENCVFEMCLFNPYCTSTFPPYMNKSILQSCSYKDTVIKEAYVDMGKIKYVSNAFNNALKKMSNTIVTDRTITNPKRYLLSEAATNRRGLFVIFDKNQHNITNCEPLSSFNDIVFSYFEIFQKPRISGPFYISDFFFSGKDRIISQSEARRVGKMLGYGEILDKDVEFINESANECFCQTKNILNNFIGKELSWNLTFDGYKIGEDLLTSVWAYDTYSNIIYQKI